MSSSSSTPTLHIGFFCCASCVYIAGRSLGTRSPKESEAPLLGAGAVWKGDGEAALGAGSQTGWRKVLWLPRKPAVQMVSREQKEGWHPAINSACGAYVLTRTVYHCHGLEENRVGNNCHTAWHCFSIASCPSSAIHATGTFAGKSKASMHFASFPYRMNSSLNYGHFSDPLFSIIINISMSITTNII